MYTIRVRIVNIPLKKFVNSNSNNRDFELKCLFENPHVVIWASNKKDWASQNGLNDWHLNHFISVVKRYSEEHDLTHKTRLVLEQNKIDRITNVKL